METDQTPEESQMEEQASQETGASGEGTPPVNEWENKYKYLYADFENYKRRTQKERVDIIKFGWEPVASELLQVIDNMERAIEHADPEKNDSSLLQGLHMTLNQFRQVLEKGGVQIIETIGKNFDPHLHEAVAQEASEEHEEGVVTQVHGKGYTLHGRLLRPARVVVSSGKK